LISWQILEIAEKCLFFVQKVSSLPELIHTGSPFWSCTGLCWLLKLTMLQIWFSPETRSLRNQTLLANPTRIYSLSRFLILSKNWTKTLIDFEGIIKIILAIPSETDICWCYVSLGKWIPPISGFLKKLVGNPF